MEDRLKFYETGDTPKKNIDVMKEAIEEVTQLASSEKKKKKKKKKVCSHLCCLLILNVFFLAYSL